jgi:ubiquinone/menaquinone biosynthesis C-methylase UbiE
MMDGPLAPAQDPSISDWRKLGLPDAWPDRLNLLRPDHIWRWLTCVFGRRAQVEVPAELPGREQLPRYLLREFHNLPNGNYSKSVTRGYIDWFDRIMLGRMKRARQRLAGYLRGCRTALDVGTGGGRTAAMLKATGVAEVWGLDPSPYMLQHAAGDHPDVRFVQGLAERTGFSDERFDGIAVCFVLHEIPGRYLSRCLAEFSRILAPGGRLAICEPSGKHLDGSFWSQLWHHGPLHAYFHLLARSVHEPFVRGWHRRDIPALLASAGFEVLGDEHEPPARFLFARKPGGG